MQRRNGVAGQRQYVKSGVSGRNTPGGRKQNNSRKILQYVIIAAVVLMGVVLAIYGITSLIQNADKPTAINARPTDNIQPFGENVLYYDGATLHCVGPNGARKWQFLLGTDADYACTSTLIVAWAGNQIQVLDKNGVSIFNDRMEDTIRFARVGEAYVAACIGPEKNSTVRVMSHTGTLLESTAFPDLYVLDMGFFYTRGQLTWVLSLDIDGNVPISNLTTLEPGRMSTGSMELDDTMVYRVYVHNNMLMVVDTSTIQAYNYRCVRQSDLSPVLVYGWYLNEVREVNKNTYALLESMPAASSGSTFSELRLVSNYAVKSLRLLAPCFASGLSEKGVYAFSGNAVYYAPYGSDQFKANFLTYTLTDVICMLDNSRAVVQIGDEIYIMKLPA